MSNIIQPPLSKTIISEGLTFKKANDLCNQKIAESKSLNEKAQVLVKENTLINEVIIVKILKEINNLDRQCRELIAFMKGYNTAKELFTNNF